MVAVRVPPSQQGGRIPTMKRREAVAWAVVLLQILILVYVQKGPASLPSLLMRNSNLRGDKKYNIKSNNNLQQVWHGGTPEAPHIRGSCWCSAQDSYCMCSPSLAIDVVLTSAPNHIWLVKRKDTGQYATMGGFVNVGESAEDAVVRELQEETGITLKNIGKSPADLMLLGFYSDPQRDKRRHTAGVVYVLDIPLEAKPAAADDVKDVQRFTLEEALTLDLFADHHTILSDYARLVSQSLSAAATTTERQEHFSTTAPFSRTICASL